eukprot:scaffold288864_cov38-Prasinocladus_malaysianus.AAC.1
MAHLEGLCDCGPDVPQVLLPVLGEEGRKGALLQQRAALVVLLVKLGDLPVVDPVVVPRLVAP